MPFNNAPLDDQGREIPDPDPIVINIGRRRLSKFDDVRAFIRAELSAQSVGDGAESFEEANDFDVPDDPPIPSNWEYSADQEADDLETIKTAAEALRRQKAALRQEKLRRQMAAASSGTQVDPNRKPASQPGAPAPPPDSSST